MNRAPLQFCNISNYAYVDARVLTNTTDLANQHTNATDLANQHTNATDLANQLTNTTDLANQQANFEARQESCPKFDKTERSLSSM